jgi:uncharacterized RDD family membrane protein YckC|tara:strand:- start:17828 stop:18772 length:945 start_codon:yes stop_codon:yes gene_type:complete
MSSSRAVNPWIRRSADPTLDRIMVTPEGVPLNVTIASAGARAGALLLDLVFIQILSTVIALLCLTLAFFFVAGGADFLDMDGPLGFVGIFYFIANFLLLNGYFIYFELGHRSATWGKRLVGIRVASRDGSRLTAEAIIARNIVRSVELFLPLTFLGSAGAGGTSVDLTTWAGFLWVLMFLLFPLFNKDRLRGGDVIAGTWVIQNVKKNLGDIVAPSAARISADGSPVAARYHFSDAELSVYGEYELQTLENVLRSDQEEALEKVATSICQKIGWEPGSGDERAFLEAYYTALRARLERSMKFGKRRKDKFAPHE